MTHTSTPLLDLANMPDTTGLISRERAMQIAQHDAELTARERGGMLNWTLGDSGIELAGPHTGKDTKQQRDLLRWYADVIRLDEVVRRFADSDNEDCGFDAIKDYRRVSTAFPPKDRKTQTAMPYVNFRYVAGKDDRVAKIHGYDAHCVRLNVRPTLRGFLEWRNSQGENVRELSESSKDNYVKQTAINLERMEPEQASALLAQAVAANPEVLRTAFRDNPEFRRTVAHVSITETQRQDNDRVIRHETNSFYREIDRSNNLEDVILLIANLNMATEQFVSQAPAAMANAAGISPDDMRMHQLREALGRWEFRDLAVHDIVRQSKEFAATGKSGLDSFLANVLSSDGA